MRTRDDLTARFEGATSGRYRIVRELGRGGMATVYLAHDAHNDRTVAIKLLHPELAAAVTAERFVREIRLLATLQHPHILPLHDSGVVDGTLYYVMPYVTGESLRDRIAREGPLALPLVLRVAAETAAALDYAHRQGVVHRDVKPENILLSDDHVLVADFGIARAAAQSADERLTATALVVGTPTYMSPEQASADAALDGRADVYSLGCVMYEMLTGAAPFAASTAAATIAARFAGAPPRVSALRPDVPAHVDAAVASAMALSPNDRPPTAGALAAMLDAGHGAVRWRRRGRAIAGVAVALVALTAALATLRVRTKKAALDRAGEPASVGVLPFDVEGGDAGDQYLGDGVADELTDALSGIPGLRVAARTAAFSFRRSALGMPEIGRRLGVRTLIGGYVRRRGRTMRVEAELTDARSGARVRTVTVDQDATDPLGLQERVARAITAALAVQLTARDSARLAARHTVDSAAHDLYLRGRYFLARPGPAAYAQATGEFEGAIAHDPQYAQAWAGLADVYSSLGIGNTVTTPPGPMFERARLAAQRALTIDSTLAEAHAALALVQMMYDYDWDAATRSLDRAQALDPDYESTYLYRSFLLSWLGRLDDAIAQSAMAIRLDPTSQRLTGEQGRVLMEARRYPEAERAFDATLQLDSTFGRVAMLRGEVRLAAGHPREALDDLRRAARLTPTSTRIVAFRSAALAATGARAEASRVVDSLQAAGDRGFVPAMDLAVAHIGVGDRAAALDWLERAYRERTLRPFVRDPIFDPLRDDPRYLALMRTLRLER